MIGGDFSYELLHAVHSIAEEDLQRALRSLADAELIYVRGIAPDAVYQFKHALIRDAAYEALVDKLQKRDFETVSPELRAMLISYFAARPSQPIPHDRKRWARAQAQIEQLRATTAN